jgi:hypothetical protein
MGEWPDADNEVTLWQIALAAFFAVAVMSIVLLAALWLVGAGRG